MDIKLNVYDDDDNVVKVCSSHSAKIRFGTVRKLMKLLKVEKISNSADMLEMVDDAWEDITKVLGRCFPDMNEEDWDGVDVAELVPVVIAILKDAVAKMNSIPTASKN